MRLSTSTLYKIKSDRIPILLIIFIIYFVVLTFISCKKETSWLNKKPNKALIVPTTLQDFQMLLDDFSTMNSFSPYMASGAVEDYLVTSDGAWSSASVIERNNYIWADNIYEATLNVDDWNSSYKAILNTNVVLDGLNVFKPSSSQLVNFNQIKGSALFFRSLYFYDLVEMFAKPYDQVTASTDLGIPLRLSSIVGDKVGRSSVKATYEQIIKDLLVADELLPNMPLAISRPSKVAVKGLLARVYLAMEDYNAAFKYSNEALNLYNALMDYNSLSTSSTTPIIRGNIENIFYRYQAISTILLSSAKIDNEFYNSFHDDDLRKTIFFNKTPTNILFKGSYSGNSTFRFSGIATDELYLIRAESSARIGNVTDAMSDLNTLLIKRFKIGKFSPVTSMNATDAITKIIDEKRKELIYRGTRWFDLRRLNKDSKYAITIIRVVNGQTYTLNPKSSKYIYLIPENEIQRSGMEQNIR